MAMYSRQTLPIKWPPVANKPKVGGGRGGTGHLEEEKLGLFPVPVMPK